MRLICCSVSANVYSARIPLHHLHHEMMRASRRLTFFVILQFRLETHPRSSWVSTLNMRQILYRFLYTLSRSFGVTTFDGLDEKTVPFWHALSVCVGDVTHPPWSFLGDTISTSCLLRRNFTNTAEETSLLCVQTSVVRSVRWAPNRASGNPLHKANVCVKLSYRRNGIQAGIIARLWLGAMSFFRAGFGCRNRPCCGDHTYQQLQHEYCRHLS